MTQTPVRPLPSLRSAPPPPFRCTCSPGRLGAARIHLSGELDLSSVPVLAEQMREMQSSSYMVVVDLRELDFIDCAGLGLLVTADTRARLRKRSLVIIHGGGQVGRMLETTGLLWELEVVDLRAPQRTDRPVLGASVTPRPGAPAGNARGLAGPQADWFRSSRRHNNLLEDFPRRAA